MSSRPRGPSRLFAAVGLALALGACADGPSGTDAGSKLAPTTGPSRGLAFPLACGLGTAAGPCMGVDTALVAGPMPEKLIVCKVYPAGTANQVPVQVRVDVRESAANKARFPNSPTSLLITVQPNRCTKIWENGEANGFDTDTLNVTELVPAGFVASSQLTTTSRSAQVNTAPYTKTINPSTGAITITDMLVGGPRAPGALVVFTNTAIPPNAPPNGSVPPVTGLEGSSVSFSTASVSDPEGDALTYAWNFGDGTSGSGANPSHVYADNGTYAVTLTVTDGKSAAVAIATTATIANVRPVPTLAILKPSIGCGQLATVNGSFTDAGINDATWTWSINWGDATATTTGASTVLSPAIGATHSYGTKTGLFTVTLTVTDKDGGSDVATVQVTNTCAPNTLPNTVVNGPYTGVEGSPVAFSSAGTVDAEGDALTYLWNFGDGGTSTLPNPTHTYADNGVYTVTLTATDGNGAPVPATTTATIGNVKPLPTLSAVKATVACTELASVTGSFTDAGINDATWTWSINWGDATALTTGASTVLSPAIAVTHDYGTNTGAHTITLTVTDKDGGANSATTSVTNACTPNTVPNPVANGPYVGVEGTAVSFSSAGSADPDGDALTYAWDFGDASTGTGAAPTHVYADNGTYVVKLTVNDGKGGIASVTTSATITNVKPVPVALLKDSSLVCAQLAQFTGTFTDAGVNDKNWAWSINWGDGTAVTTGAATTQPGPIAATHDYALNNGSFTLTFTVTDKDGGSSSTTVPVKNTCLANKLPTTDAQGPYKGYEGSAVTMTATGSDPDGDALTYTWDFGDGTTGTGKTTTHVYADNGTYTVKVTANDGKGGIATDNTTAVIYNVAPKADIDIDAALVYCYQNASVKATFSDAGVKDMAWKWSIDWGDNSTDTQGSATTQSGVIAATHAYTKNGTFTVTFKVTDKDGASDYATTKVTMKCRFAKCVLSDKYWMKNDNDWPLPYDNDQAWFNNKSGRYGGRTWEDVLNTKVSSNNDYIYLAHEYIAAQLNRSSGSAMRSDVLAALNSAASWLQANTPANGSIPTIKSSQANSLADLLDRYNNGKAGTVMCSNDQDDHDSNHSSGDGCRRDH